MATAAVDASIQQQPPLLLHVWSGPRSLSTAMMYSFSRHSCCSHCADEPLYAAYLQRHPHLQRPYREQLLAQAAAGVGGQHLPASAAMQRLIDTTTAAPQGSFVYAKHIAKMYDDREITDAQLQSSNNDISSGSGRMRAAHVLLVRNPLHMIRSWADRGANGAHALSAEDACCLEATNLPQLVAISSRLRRISSDSSSSSEGRMKVVVVDVDQLKRSPRLVLTALCSELQLRFEEQMLHWPAGPKPNIDGMWAAHWYGAVHASSGFSTQDDDASTIATTGETTAVSTGAVSEQVLQVYREALPFYLLLANQAIGLHPLSRGLSQNSPAAEGVEEEAAAAVVVDHGISFNSAEAVRNANILIWVGDRLLPREYAAVSVFDSTVQGGDAVWEGLRVYDGRVLKLEEHLQRLSDSAVAMGFERVPSRQFVRSALFQTLRANSMRDGVHVRLTLSRGLKSTSSMNPRFNSFGCWLLVVPEFKPVGNAATYDNRRGVDLITATNRRSAPATLDNKIHHNNLIQNILAKLQANLAGAADALMLDSEGFVSETNATNVFLVKNGVVHTPSSDYCLPGITRRAVMQLVQSAQWLPPLVERRISLSEFHAADEVFTSGTMGELTPVRTIDGRRIGAAVNFQRSVTTRIQEAYRELTEHDGVPIP